MNIRGLLAIALILICSATIFGQASVTEVEPNNTFAQADAALPAISSSTIVTGAITPIGDQDTFKVVVSAAGVVQFETFTNSGANDCTAGTTMDLRLFDSAGVQLLADSAGEGIGQCGAISLFLNAGSYYIRNEERGNNAVVALYTLRILFSQDRGIEIEPNETQSTATPLQITPPSYIFGDHPNSTDSDFYMITVGGGQSVRAEIIEGDGSTETCESLGVDSLLTLYNAAGTPLVSDDDAGRGFCSQIDGKGTTPLYEAAKNLAAGTYYLQVQSSTVANDTGAVFKYRLVVELSGTQAAPTYEADVFPRGSGSGAVTSSDVSIIQGFQLGFGLPYQSNEFQRADCAPFSDSPFTRGDGRVTSIDVSQAQGYQLGFNLAAGSTLQPAAGPTCPTSGCGPTAFEFDSWIGADKFNQANSPSGVQAPREVRIVSPTVAITAANPQTVTVPINVDAMGDESVYGFSISYNTNIFSNPVVTIGTAGGAVVENTSVAGKIGFSINGFAGNRIAAGNDRNLVNVTFTIVKQPGTYPINFTNDPTQQEVASAPPNVVILPTTFTSGSVTITGTTAATVSVGGRVATSEGRGITNIRLSLTDSNGQVRTVISGANGYYSFSDVESGSTYIITATGKRYSFAQPSQVLNINEEMTEINFIANPEKRLRVF